MDKTAKFFLSPKYFAALWLVVGLVLPGCKRDVAYVPIVGEETTATADAPRLDPLTLNVRDEMIDRELARFEESETVPDEVASSEPAQEQDFEATPTPPAEPIPARQNSVAEEKNPVDDFFFPDPTIDRLDPTEYVIIGGKPVRLEDGMCLRQQDLSGAHINNVTLSRVDFRGANLSGANLCQARFYRCNFQHANLSDVKTEDTRFLDCDFTGATVGSDRSPELAPEEFRSTQNYEAKRISDRVYEAENDDFSNFTFQNARIRNAQGCDFTEASFLEKCYVTNMTKEQLVSTRNYKEKKFPDSLTLINEEEVVKSLSGTDFSRCRIRNLSFHNYDLSEVDFTDAVIDGTLGFFNCVGLTLEQLKSTDNWKRKIFSFNTSFDWSNIDFSGFRFESSLGSGNIEGAQFTDAQVKKHTFADNQSVTVEQIKSTWNFKNREMKLQLKKTDLDWSGTDFSNFTFEGNALENADVTGADFTDAKFLDYYPMENCRGLTVEQIKSTWNYKNNNVTMKTPKDIADQLRAEQEKNATEERPL